MSNLRSHYWPSSVDEALSKLEYMDSITVIWVDASLSGHVEIPKKGEAFLNHNVETRVSSAGQFLRVQEGSTYNDSHILILKDISDTRRGSLQAIPLALVKSITINGHVKEQLISRKSTRLAKFLRSRTRNKNEIHFAEGSTKQIGGW